ncbi:MAG: LuxR C-terminal-related transcriptional regulator [Thermomicrobiales bacterium]
MDHAPPDPLPRMHTSRSLPRPLSGFLGRDQERAALASLLITPEIRLLTLTGPGGIGKTRLAVEVALSLDNEFPDGIVFVPLAPTNDPELVPAALAEAVDLTPRADLSASDALHEVIQDKRILIVLDNMEHLLPAAPFLAKLLQAHPLVTILATSRTRLELTGEYVFTLESLAPTDARTLFQQRAGALDAGHTRTDDAATIDAICARLDRIPLAIELAAARTATLPPETLLDRLSQPLSILRNGLRDVPLRQQTMRDTIAWSYDLLDDAHRTGFRQLAVFVGGFTLTGAQAVLGKESDALDLVDFLVARSLVVPMPGESSQPRFAMLESIRQFGMEELLASGDDEKVRTAHADWLIQLAEDAVPYYDGPLLHAYLSMVWTEMDNIRAALAWSLNREDGIRANRLAGAVWRVWGSGESRWQSSRPVAEVRREARAWSEKALAISAAVPFEHVVEAMCGMGLLLDSVEETDRKSTLMEELLVRSNAASLPHGAYWAHFALADVARIRGDWPTARAEAEAAIALAPLIRDPDNQRCGAEIHFAGILYAEGNLDAARSHYLTALEFGERAGNPLHLSLATISLSSVYRRLGDSHLAADYALKALDILASLNDVARTRVPMLTLAELARKQGQYAEAICFLAHAASVPGFMNGLEVDETRIAPYRDLLPESQFAAAWQEGSEASPAAMRAKARAFAETTTPGPQIQIVTLPSPLLSPREEEVLRLLVAGRTNRAIGQELFISERTVEKHVLHIMTKLDLDSRTGIVAWAVRNGVA